MLNERSSKVIIFILGVSMVLLGGYKTLIGSIADATLSFVIAVILLLLTQIEYLKSFKALGLEAVLKDKIDEADTLLAQLKSISLPLTEMLFSTMAHSGRYGKMSRRDENAYVEKITGQLKLLGVAENLIDTAKKDVYYFNAFDMASAIKSKLSSILHEKEGDWFDIYNRAARVGMFDQVLMDKSNEQLSLCRKERIDLKGLLKVGDYSLFSLELKGFIKKMESLSDDEKKEFLSEQGEDILDLDYFIANRKIRRPNVWFAE